MVIGELVATPIAASRHASTMNAMNTQVSVESSPVLEMTSSQMTASAASPGALRSARRTPSPIAMSSACTLIEPRRSTAKLPQAAEDFLDTLAGKIGLDQVTARLASRAREHNEVGRPSLAAKYRLYLITEISRGHHPYMQQRHGG